tara:strand:+ start:2844 stop:3485 length:642 start_codon:yes stop_codon:yes gene_type:complete
MSIKDKYSVQSIDSKETYEWLLHKHYAKRIPSISYAFGLFESKILIGVLTVGKPASPALCDGICGKKYTKYVYELNRLCINDHKKKNLTSYFVGCCLKLIDKPKIIVSYADTQQNHNGYIYQATNWIYTGKTQERTDIGNDDKSHSRHYNKNLDYKKNRKFRSSKHRYTIFLGSKTQKKNMLSNLKYEIKPYPKGQNKRYDASYNPTIQTKLF